MNILGVSCYYHDASATLVRDGQVLAAAEEERFTRKKHDHGFPEQAVRFCLRKAGMDCRQLDVVCFYEKPFRKVERLLVCGKRWEKQSGEWMRGQLSQILHENLFFENAFRERFAYEKEFAYTDHHLAHAASAYYISDFDEAAVLTIDGVGEWATTAQFTARGNALSKLREIRYPHSLGLLYSTLTAFLGFKVNSDEYKVMGLASYGRPNQVDKIRRLIRLYPDGSFRLGLEYFSFMHDSLRMFSQALIDLLGSPRLPEEEITPYHADLAASLQFVTEEVLVALSRDLYEQSGGLKNLCLAGGVALNCVANRKLAESTPFKRFCIQPAAGDGGGSMGAALYAYYKRPDALRMKNPYSTLLGPEFSRAEIKRFLEQARASFMEYDEPGILKKTAELIHKDQIVGWFQGRMEFGPRALGNRSILANALNPGMKDILNSRVKFREDFRPFAPAILWEKSREYFDMPFESPYMLFIAPVKPGMAEKIPSVTHVDNTARLQTVTLSQNPRFYGLIKEFEKISGVPVVINTSFNVKGEPIVCTPEDAYACFMKTDIDFLVMDTFLVQKEV